MYDSVDVSTVPDNPPAVAGYVGGHWPTYVPLVQKFPKAHHLSIAVNASERARCLDIESGDAVVTDAPDWLRHKYIGPGKPVLYTSAGNADALIHACGAGGIARGQFLLWSAHYGQGEHLCGPHTCGYPQADGTQWTDAALGRNLDQSILNNDFFEEAPPPSPHYDWYYTGPFESPKWGKLNERSIVEQYDNARKHPLVNVRVLRKLRAELQFLAFRIYAVAHTDLNKNGTPSWGKFSRGWRFAQITKRVDGQRLV